RQQLTRRKARRAPARVLPATTEPSPVTVALVRSMPAPTVPDNLAITEITPASAHAAESPAPAMAEEAVPVLEVSEEATPPSVPTQKPVLPATVAVEPAVRRPRR